MKDKKKKYDLSYFIKDGGNISPSVNESEMNANEMKKRLKELNNQLAEQEENEIETGINFSPENPEAPEAPKEDTGNNSNNNDSNNDNNNLGKSGREERIQRNINAEITQAENRLNALMNRFALETQRNREQVDMTPVDINNPSAAAADAAFELNSKRRKAEEAAAEKKEREKRRRVKEGLNEENESEFNRGSAAVAKKSSNKQKALSKEEMIDKFFEFVTTSDRATELTKEQINQFSQNPLGYIEWARRTLLTGPQRKQFRDLTSEQLLSRLPRNLQALFERLRIEFNALSELQRLRPTKTSNEPPILRLRTIQPVEASSENQPQLLVEVSSETEPNSKVKVSSKNTIVVNTAPIMVDPHGRELPPDFSDTKFNINKTKIKKKNKESLPILPIKRKPINLNEEKKSIENTYSEKTKLLVKLQLNKTIREIKKKLVNGKFNDKLEEKSYIEELLNNIKESRNKNSLNNNIPKMTELIKRLNEIKNYKNINKLKLVAENKEEEKKIK